MFGAAVLRGNESHGGGVKIGAYSTPAFANCKFFDIFLRFFCGCEGGFFRGIFERKWRICRGFWGGEGDFFVKRLDRGGWGRLYCGYGW